MLHLPSHVMRVRLSLAADSLIVWIMRPRVALAPVAFFVALPRGVYLPLARELWAQYVSLRNPTLQDFDSELHKR